jgi:hypothetical protein
VQRATAQSKTGIFGGSKRINVTKDLVNVLSTTRQLFSDADISRLVVLDHFGNPVGFIDFTTEFKYLGSIVHHSLTSNEDVDKRSRPASAVFGALKDILTNKHIDLKVKGKKLYYTSLEH